MTREEKALLPQERIESKIYVIRGENVMLDSDLAHLYGVLTKILNKAVKRNLKRFPRDFMFQLTEEEVKIVLRFQIGTSKRGGRRYLPYAFTENGVAMLSSVLNSERAMQVNVQIMRTFTRIRKLLSSHQEILKRLDRLEDGQTEHRDQIVKIFDVIQRILDLPVTLKRKTKRIGFVLPDKK
jgi:hypothetical protein